MQVEIVRMDDLGRGICYVDGKVTFVPKVVEGDIVLIDICKVKKNYNEASLVKIITPSPKRIEPKCPYFEKCGGCDLQMMDYKDTCKYKKEKVIKAFKRKNLEVNPEVIVNSQPYNYRNKITLKIDNGKIGFYQEKSHVLIEIKNCDITNNAINEVIPLIKSFNILNGSVVIRCNQNEEILIWIKTNEKLNIDIEKIKKYGKLKGIVINDECFYGESYLVQEINGLKYNVSYDAFFQVNPIVAGEIFKVVKDNINSSDKVLDLYCGVGTLGLSSLEKAEEVVGVEVVKSAVENAKLNASINFSSKRASFLLHDANKNIDSIDVEFNKLIVDPPRSGLSMMVKDFILKRKPDAVIYVSCDLQTLVRDVLDLNECYEINKLYVADMFSYTHHVECVCVLGLR